MKKGTFTNIILVLILIVGLSLLLYPSFSDYWNSLHQTRVIKMYSEQVATLDNEHYKAIIDEAKEYNKLLLERDNPYYLPDDLKELYNQRLNLSGNGVIGYVEVPSINCFLPIYHGTEEVVLQVGIGHLEWTSLPTGGESTHCVISGHRGLPSAKLFTDLDKLREGDVFMLHVLEETLTYEVDQILIVEPTQIEDLLIVDGKDLCTLFTCTPYAVNTHRLLVRGHRIENLKENVQLRVTSDAMRIEPLLIAIILFIPILLLELILVMIFDRFNKPDKRV